MNLTILTHLLSALAMIALPGLLGLYLWRRFHAGWRFFWIGVATMVLAQVGHIPFNYALTWLFQQKLLPAPPEAYQLPFNALVLGLSAGLWEEIFRYFAYRWAARDARSWGRALMLGAGHGGIEAAVLGLLSLYSLIQIVALSGMGDLSQVLPVAQLAAVQQQLDAYWAAPWYMNLLGIVERLMAMTFHLTFSVLVLQVFLRRQARWLWLAVALHALVDFLAVLLMPSGALVVEAALALVTLGALALLAWLSRTTPADPGEPDGPGAPGEPAEPARPRSADDFSPLDDNDSALDDSRYR